MNLDNIDQIKQADPEQALTVISNSADQLSFQPELHHEVGEHGEVRNIIISGMGGSCLAGLICRTWLDHDYQLSVPLEVSRDYQLPAYTDSHSLVICVSVSGNTEETISSLTDAQNKGAMTTVITSGGKLLELAIAQHLPYIQLDKISQPRYGVPMHLLAITGILEAYQVIDHQPVTQLVSSAEGVRQFAQSLTPEVATEHNPAKKLALDCAGKTPLVYTSRLFSPLAYKWKTSFNENAKNIIWCNEFPEFNHNEFIGWTSHPIDKPFCVINLRSNLDNPRINRRLDLTDRLLSGFRPQAHNLTLAGQSYIEQVLNGAILGDMASIYLAFLNGVDPTPVALVEKFKQELVK